MTFTNSASQLETHDTCPRKWALGRVLPKRESDASQAGGVILHKLQEDYLTHGKRQDGPLDPAMPEDEAKLWHAMGRRAVAAMEYLPPPGSGGVEGGFTATISGLRYTGFMDWQGPSERLPRAPHGLPAALDHKTSSDPSAYGLWAKDAFLAAPQPLIYSAKLLVAAPRADAVFLRWIYYSTKHVSRVTPSDVVLSRAEVLEAFGPAVHAPASRMAELAPQIKDVASANALTEPCTGACGKYRGCQYRPLTAGEDPALPSNAQRGACVLTPEQQYAAELEALNSPGKAAIVQISKKPVRASNDNAKGSDRMTTGAPDLFAQLQASMGGAPAPAPSAPANPFAQAARPTLPGQPNPFAQAAAPAQAVPNPFTQAAPAGSAPAVPNPFTQAAPAGAAPAVPNPFTQGVDLINPPEATTKAKPKAHARASQAAPAAAPDTSFAFGANTTPAMGVTGAQPGGEPSAPSKAKSKAKLDGMLAASEQAGLRTQLAHTAMAQLIAAVGITLDPDEVADRAVLTADALLRRLAE